MNDTQDALIERVVKELMNPVSGNGNSNITVHAGGPGLWLAVGCTVLMAVVLAIVIPIGVGAFLFQQGQITKLQQGENAIRAYIHTGKLPPAPQEKTDE